MGEQIVARQREIIARLERAGCEHPTPSDCSFNLRNCNRYTSRIATDWKKRLPKFQNDPLPSHLIPCPYSAWRRWLKISTMAHSIALLTSVHQSSAGRSTASQSVRENGGSTMGATAGRSHRLREDCGYGPAAGRGSWRAALLRAPLRRRRHESDGH
jgi:hypothetical protein